MLPELPEEIGFDCTEDGEYTGVWPGWTSWSLPRSDPRLPECFFIIVVVSENKLGAGAGAGEAAATPPLTAPKPTKWPLGLGGEVFRPPALLTRWPPSVPPFAAGWCCAAIGFVAWNVGCDVAEKAETVPPDLSAAAMPPSFEAPLITACAIFPKSLFSFFMPVVNCSCPSWALMSASSLFKFLFCSTTSFNAALTS